jgi:hypothetical protein
MWLGSPKLSLSKSGKEAHTESLRTTCCSLSYLLSKTNLSGYGPPKDRPHLSLFLSASTCAKNGQLEPKRVRFVIASNGPAAATCVRSKIEFHEKQNGSGEERLGLQPPTTLPILCSSSRQQNGRNHDAKSDSAVRDWHTPTVQPACPVAARNGPNLFSTKRQKYPIVKREKTRDTAVKIIQ